MGYGTGAIMAVPAHDERDLEFATKFGLPIRPGRSSRRGRHRRAHGAFTGDGVAVNRRRSSTGLPTARGQDDRSPRGSKRKGLGTATVNYRLRDWLFSRQRYWGEPIPDRAFPASMARSQSRRANCRCACPRLKDYTPTRQCGAAAGDATDWVNTNCPLLRRRWRARDEHDAAVGRLVLVLPALSSIRRTTQALRREGKRTILDAASTSTSAAREHAVLHLLYARFWHKVLFDLGLVSTPEPFLKLVNQGMILGENGEKMSKARGNVVNPDDVVREYGADALRVYEMFMGPLEAMKPWNTQGLEGVYRFLGRVWRLYCNEDGKLILDDSEPAGTLLKVLHQTIKKVGEDTEALAFNTAISQMMIFVNEVTAQERRPRKLLEPFVLALAPYAPHLAEELWEKLGHQQTLAYEAWPGFDEALLKENTVTVILQVNGKVRDRVDTPAEISREDLEKLALANERVREHLAGKQVKKIIVVTGKLVNVVAG